MSIGLYHDLALATDRFGSDLWAHRPFFVAGCRVGSPPDDFAPKGQDWGFPPPNALRPPRGRLPPISPKPSARMPARRRAAHGSRDAAVPPVLDSRRQRRYPGRLRAEVSLDFLRILALESVRNSVVVVGEDLGTVEPAMRETLEQFGILSYRLFYFEKNSAASSAATASTRGRRWFRPPPTICRRWPVFGPAPTWTRAAPPAPSTKAGFDAQTAHRAVEKQKMLDMLFAQKLMPRTAARRRITRR
jgi:4-alpha-glucanotransferase